jgi:hypothetical protein
MQQAQRRSRVWEKPPHSTLAEDDIRLIEKMVKKGFNQFRVEASFSMAKTERT